MTSRGRAPQHYATRLDQRHPSGCPGASDKAKERSLGWFFSWDVLMVSHHFWEVFGSVHQYDYKYIVIGLQWITACSNTLAARPRSTHAHDIIGLCFELDELTIHLLAWNCCITHSWRELALLPSSAIGTNWMEDTLVREGGGPSGRREHRCTSRGWCHFHPQPQQEGTSYTSPHESINGALNQHSFCFDSPCNNRIWQLTHPIRTLAQFPESFKLASIICYHCN